MRSVIVTKELLIDVMGACDIGPNFIEENNMWGQSDEDVILPALLEAGYVAEVEWWREQKTTEKFVRAIGKVWTMNGYQLFNSFTGQHTKYETEEEAKVALVELAQQVLEMHTPRLVIEMVNEHGDAVWEPTNVHEELKVVL